MNLSAFGIPAAVTAKWLCILGIAYTVAQSAWLFMAGTEAMSTAPLTPPSDGTANPRTRPALNVDAVLERHLFGIADAAPQASAQPVAATETRLPLELQAVFVATDDAKGSRAIVAQKNNSGRLYRIGDDLPGGVRLDAVYGDHVVLSRGATRERLTFPRLKASLALPMDDLPQPVDYQDAGMDYDTSEPIQAEPASTEPPLDVPEETDPQQVLDDYQARLQADPVGTLDALGVQPVEAGAARGYRVGNLASAPGLRQTGLQPGDIIVSVDGQPVGNVEADRSELAGLLARGSARIEIQRGSRRFFVTTTVGN
ncbi:MAG: type II secretion system protein N [Pseudomonadales bacterium]